MKSDPAASLGSDGYRVRDNGEWGIEKLAFIDAFGPQALLATKSKLSRHYVDLFAGPGRNRVRGGQSEFDGSPLRALELTTHGQNEVAFTDAVFLNRDRRDHSALKARVHLRVSDGRSRIPAAHVVCRHGDANLLIGEVMKSIHPRAYAFVFADMEAPKQFPWSSVQTLVDFGHQSVDLYMLLPLDMAIKRLISSNSKTVEQCSEVLTAFYGSEAWRPLLDHRKGSSHALGAAAQALYIKQLKGLWKYAGEVRDIRRGANHRLYKMLYASNNDAGVRIAKWAAKRTAPPTLFDKL